MSKCTTPALTVLSLLLCLLVFVSTGCSMLGGDVAIVKKSVFESIDKSITVGQAFAGFKYFKSTKWEDKKDAQGRRFVIATSVVDVTSPEAQPMVNGNPYKQFDATKPCQIEIQFLINSDNTVECDKPNVLKEIYSNQFGGAMFFHIRNS